MLGGMMREQAIVLAGSCGTAAARGGLKAIESVN
jgi:hypothetical protein